jgi:hypothetical protein
VLPTSDNGFASCNDLLFSRPGSNGIKIVIKICNDNYTRKSIDSFDTANFFRNRYDLKAEDFIKSVVQNSGPAILFEIEKSYPELNLALYNLFFMAQIENICNRDTTGNQISWIPQPCRRDGDAQAYNGREHQNRSDAATILQRAWRKYRLKVKSYTASE